MSKPVAMFLPFLLPTGTSVAFYETATLSPEPIYQTDALDPLHVWSNPFIIPGDPNVTGFGMLPPFWIDGTVKYRCQVLFPGASVPSLDMDPINEFLSISGADLEVGAVVANLGYVPANKAGDVFTGNTGANFVPTVINQTDFGFALRAPNIKDTSYHLALSDCGRTIKKDDTSSGDVYTLDPHATTPYPPGFWFRVRVTNTNSVSVARGAGVTLRLAGASTNQDVTCAEWCDLTFTCDAIDEWSCVGTGGS